jgi:hypothetical protein
MNTLSEQILKRKRRLFKKVKELMGSWLKELMKKRRS